MTQPPSLADAARALLEWYDLFVEGDISVTQSIDLRAHVEDIRAALSAPTNPTASGDSAERARAYRLLHRIFGELEIAVFEGRDEIASTAALRSSRDNWQRMAQRYWDEMQTLRADFQNASDQADKFCADAAQLEREENERLRETPEKETP